MSRPHATLSLLLASLAACSSDPTVPAEPGTGTDEGTTTTTTTTALDGELSTDTGTTDPDDDPSTDTGNTTAVLDGDTSTGSGDSATGSEGTQTDGTSSTGDTDTSSDTGTDTGEPEPICGDGMVGGDEACDDGGESASCNADCTPTVCGDGVVNGVAGELCDDGGESASCNVGCTLAACGDAVFNASAGEACDDGVRTAACNADCTLATCGDGVLNALAGEACDDGGESPGCNVNCTLASCGDGVTNAIAGEACDDAGFSVACNADCTITTCGDLLVNPVAGEECDGDVLGVTCEDEGFYGGALACGAGCGLATDDCYDEPGVPTLAIGFSQVKRFDFAWSAVLGAEQYELFERAAPGEPLVSIAAGIVGESLSIPMPLHFRYQASYVLRACNGAGCTDSAEVGVVGSLSQAVGYFKASNAAADDWFGWSVALSGDGNTLAVGAYNEDSNATGIGGNQASNAASTSGAVYVFVRDAAGQWSQQAYVKASNTGSFDWFGWTVALSDDGDTLAVSARQEESNATGVNGNQFNNTGSSGAAYVFVRNAMDVWSQQAYFKASNTGLDDVFGYSLDVSGDGNTLAVGALYEDSNAIGIGGSQANNLAADAGAVYVFGRNGMGLWAQQAYVKASNTGAGDNFGSSVALSTDGDTLAVGAQYEDGNATGIDGNQADNSVLQSGAAYVFVRNAMDAWSQQAYVKASNTGSGGDDFGRSLALSGDGNTLAVGSRYEDSNATGIDGNQANDAAIDSGAVYVFVRNGIPQWSQQAYVKSSNNTGSNDWFGTSLALSNDGSTLAVGATFEDGGTTGVGGNQADDSALNAGAVYVLVRDGSSEWSQRAYLKASNAGPIDEYGVCVALSADGRTLAVGSHLEDGAATGIAGDPTSETAAAAGAVYLY
jgi:hypothetical protein